MLYDLFSNNRRLESSDLGFVCVFGCRESKVEEKEEKKITGNSGLILARNAKKPDRESMEGIGLCEVKENDRGFA